MQAAPLLRDMQALLGALYDLQPAEDVRDYLVTDHRVLAALAGGDTGRDIDEKLLVIEGPDVLDLALYLDAAVLERLAGADPREQLSPRNLGDFWTVLEGVSHFTYLAWNASLDKPVTLLELEMQAEVDKYVATRHLLAAQPATDLGGPLLERLFDEPAYAPDLEPGELERYRDAAHLAGRYCRDLHARYAYPRLCAHMVRELRCFYRLPQGAKVSRIRRACFA